MIGSKWRGVVAFFAACSGVASAAEGVPATALIVSPPAAMAAKPVLRYGVFAHCSYPSAWTAAQKSNRPILVYACSPSCPHCVRMVGETYQAPAIKRMVNESFARTYVDSSDQPALVAKLHIRMYPTTILVSPNNVVLDVIEGYVDAKTLSRRLQTTVAAHDAATRTR